MLWPAVYNGISHKCLNIVLLYIYSMLSSLHNINILWGKCPKTVRNSSDAGESSFLCTITVWTLLLNLRCVCTDVSTTTQNFISQNRANLVEMGQFPLSTAHFVIRADINFAFFTKRVKKRVFFSVALSSDQHVVSLYTSCWREIIASFHVGNCLFY